MKDRDVGAAGLGALLLGLLATPWVYVIVFGALFAFPWPFAVVAGLLLVGATLHLGREAFSRRSGLWWARVVGGVVSVGVVLVLLGVLSGFTLLTQAERVGLFATVWLGAALLWLIVSLRVGAVGPEALLRPRLTSLTRQRAALAAMLLLYGGLAVLSWHYLMTPSSFIGGPTHEEIGARSTGGAWLASLTP